MVVEHTERPCPGGSGDQDRNLHIIGDTWQERHSMTFNRNYQVEIMFSQLHRVGRDLDVNPDAWSDALYEVLPGDRSEESSHRDIAEARRVARRLLDEAGVPPEEVRITLTEQSAVELDESGGVEAVATPSGMQLYHWRSVALRNYGSGYVFGIGRTVDEAREAATRAFDAYIRTDDWRGDYFDRDGAFRDEDSREEYEKIVIQFREDIAVVPKLMSDAFVVTGSE
jgi:hypothetical protein